MQIDHLKFSESEHSQQKVYLKHEVEKASLDLNRPPSLLSFYHQHKGSVYRSRVGSSRAPDDLMMSNPGLQMNCQKHSSGKIAGDFENWLSKHSALVPILSSSSLSLAQQLKRRDAEVFCVPLVKWDIQSPAHRPEQFQETFQSPNLL